MPIVIGPQARHPLLWATWFDVSVPRLLKRLKPDLFLSQDGYLPLRSNVPSYCVIHDINFYHRPNDLPFFTRTYFNLMFPMYAKKATRLGTVSAYSKKDIAHCYQVEEDKIDILYNGANETYAPISTNEQENVRAQLTDGKPYSFLLAPFCQEKM
ncbi:MAG: glycosyltransferase family 4 protein [Bacteroidales bacterium]|nr:glycosyltransferase family 4 protein [Bacteroidales bacterium]